MIVHNVKVVVIGGCMEEKQWKGMALAILGTLLWWLSGTSVQFLENAKHINVEWLLEARFAHSRYIDDRTCLYKGW